MATVDASEIELTTAQSAILTELLNINNRSADGPVKGKDIAAAIDRNPGTIRTQMQSLKSLQLVEGIPGPKGGYVPTSKAYEIIDLERSNEYTVVPFEQEGELLEGVTVTEFDLINLHHPDRHECELYVQGSIRQIEEGATVKLGPTPGSELVVRGVVDGLNLSEQVCILHIGEMYFDESRAESER